MSPHVQVRLYAHETGLYHLSVNVLLPRGNGQKGRFVFLGYLARRRILWSARGRYLEHGWKRWKGRMGLDLHSVSTSSRFQRDQVKS